MVTPISNTEPAAARASTKENPRLAYATGSTGLAITVRGSSRRIMIMRFRPANIRLINRRSKLLRLLLALSSGKENANYQNNPTDLAQLTRSLHIRPFHLSRRSGVNISLFRAVGRQLFENLPATQRFGSIPMRSLTADRIRCLQPRYRSVV
jgi:hypothetical protein